MQRIRKSGPHGVVRPFTPTIDMNNSMPVEKKQLEVLEHIALALSAIDHNLEVLAKSVERIAQKQ